MTDEKKGYVLAIIDVHDPATFREYTSRTPEVIKEFGGRFVSRGTDYDVMEGGPDKRRIVIVEFDSPETAKRFYHSSGYQTAAAYRRASATTEFFILSEYAADRPTTERPISSR